MLSLRVCLITFLFAAWTVSGGKIVFEESADTSADHQPANTESSSTAGTRNGPFSDSVTVEAAGTPGSGEPDGRIFGLFGGGGHHGGGLLGGLLGGGGAYHNPGGIAPGFGGPGIGGTKPGRCPGLLGLGFGQPEGGYGYPPHGHYNNGGFGHAFGGAPIGHGVYPGVGYYGHGGHNGFGFRSADQSSDGNGEKSESSRRRRSDDATEVKKESDGDSAAQGRALGNDHQTDPRLLGLFGQSCFYDLHCPGQLKCCAGMLGKHATCQQPALFG